MCKKPLSCLIIFILLFKATSFLSAQYSLCPDEVRANKEIVLQGEIDPGDNLIHNGSTYTLILEVKYPTCISSNDGSITIKSLHILDIKSRLWNIKDAKYLWLTDPSTIHQAYQTSAIKLPYSSDDDNDIKGVLAGELDLRLEMWYGFPIFIQSAINFKVPLPEFFISTLNTSCPETEDGEINVVNSTIPNSPMVEWNNVEESGFNTKNLKAGIYTGVYSFDAGGHRCCRNIEAEVQSNFCGIECGNYDFLNNQIFIPGQYDGSSFGDIIDGVFYANQNNASFFMFQDFQAQPNDWFFISYDWLSVPLPDGHPPTSVIINQYSPNEQIFPFTGSGPIEMYFPSGGLDVNSISITGPNGSGMDNVLLLKGTVDPLLVGYEERRSNNDTTSISTCTRDELFLSSGVTVSGGITPYQFSWDTDSDGIYDEIDSLTHVFSFETPVSYNISLKIEDQVGQQDTINYVIEVLEEENIQLSIPQLNIQDTSLIALNLCTQDAPINFVFDTSYVLEDTNNLIDSNLILNPSLIDPGLYQISVSGSECTVPALVLVNIEEPVSVQLEAENDFFLCDGFLDLNTLLSGDTLGLWVINDTFPYFRSVFDSLFTPEVGIHELKFIAGVGSCRLEDSMLLNVIEFPNADLKDLAIQLEEGSEVFNLNTFYSEFTTLGGTWSGGDYVSPDGVFDPGSLAPGTYDIIYTVGEGNCEQMETRQIEIKAKPCELDPTVLPNDLILCPNSSDTLWTQEYDSYQWFRDGVELAGATNQYLIVDAFNFSGTIISVEITEGSCTETSPQVLVDGWAFIPPTVQSSGDFEFNGSEFLVCTGDTIFFQLMLPYNTNIQWTLEGNVIPDETLENLFVTSQEETTTINYGVCGAPEVCPNYIQCLGVNLPVRIIKCTSSIDEYVDSGITIFPNPTRDFVNIIIEEEVIGSSYIIIDQWGRTVRSSKLLLERNRINISELSKGLYFISILEKESAIITILKE
jgi:hypothetical protein